MNHYEIEASVMRAKNGNQGELIKILEQYKPFIFKTARQFNIKDYDMYDMVQIGYVALINAVAKYRASSHTFSTYAYQSIKNAFKYAARKNNKFNNDLSLNSQISPNGNTSTEFIDCIDSLENLEEDILRTERILEVKRAVSKLPADEIELVIMVYYSNCSLKTYADKKGLSYLQAVRKKNRILEKLSYHLKK